MCVLVCLCMCVLCNTKLIRYFQRANSLLLHWISVSVTVDFLTMLLQKNSHVLQYVNLSAPTEMWTDKASEEILVQWQLKQFSHLNMGMRNESAVYIFFFLFAFLYNGWASLCVTVCVSLCGYRQMCWLNQVCLTWAKQVFRPTSTTVNSSSSEVHRA